MLLHNGYNKAGALYLRYLLLKKIFLSNFLRLRFPYKLTFTLTYKCNLECKTCFIWKKKHQEELTLNEIDRFFKKSNSFSWIDLTGGEIFLREDLLDILEIIFKHCRNLCILHFHKSYFSLGVRSTNWKVCDPPRSSYSYKFENFCEGVCSSPCRSKSILASNHVFCMVAKASSP